MNWQKAYQAADFVFYCLLINVTVIIGALVGGIIFGLAPSVQAGFHVAKKTLKQESPPFFQTFFGYYRRNFWRSNRLGLPIILFYLCPMVVIQQGFLAALTQTGLILLIVSQCVAIAVINTLLSMYEYYVLPTKKYLGASLRFLFFQPIGTFLGVLWFGICSTISFFLPGLLPFLSIGMWIIGTMGIYLKLFDENERKLKQQKDAGQPAEREEEEIEHGIEMAQK